jgi:NO-binding membrane sensor protein with MHYT domain
MERTRTSVGTPGWLWVNLAAMGFSLGHTVADLGIIFGSLSSGFGVPQSLLSVLIAVLYTWWAWAFAKAVGGAKSWLVESRVTYTDLHRG